MFVLPRLPELGNGKVGGERSAGALEEEVVVVAVLLNSISDKVFLKRGLSSAVLPLPLLEEKRV